MNEHSNTSYTFQREHRVSTVDELTTIRDQYQEQLRAVDSFDEQIGLLESQLDASYKELLQQASMLSEQYKITSTTVASRSVKVTIPLGMPNTRFRVDILPRKKPENDKMNDIRSVFSANKSTELQPVARTASGGEISRLMLCIKVIIAGFTTLPTTISDEVDTGVSGDIVDKMGDIMQELGTKMQVFAIIRLPQIATKGQAHYFVHERDTEDRTLARIRQLEEEERVNEVARTLNGASLTETSLASTKDLLGIKD